MIGLQELARAKGSVQLEVDRRPLRLSNLGKVLWPEAGFTKGEMLDYYRRIAPVLLPHLRRRPLTVARFPEGVEDGYWFQTQCRNRPPWMRTATVGSRLTPGKLFEYCVVDDLSSLLWVANLGSIELHPLLSRAEDVDRPTVLVFDLDPGFPAGLLDCCDVALRLHERLRSDGLMSVAKTSGSKGLQVYVPLNQPISYTETKSYARRIAGVLAAEEPQLIVDRADKALRSNKVFVDWHQNAPVRSTVAVYSLRAMRAPTVSMPLRWEELRSALEQRSDDALFLTAPDAIERVERVGDLFAPVLDVSQALPG